MEGYVRLREVAKYLGVSTWTVRRRVGEARAGLHDFPFHQYRPGTVSPLYFKLSEVELWVQRQALVGRKRQRALRVLP